MTNKPSGLGRAAELEDLRTRLAEAEEALLTIHNGGVDAVLVNGRRGEQVYTLNGADRVYRQLIETMSEGAATLSVDGVILYGNDHLAKMLGRPLDRVLGTALRNYLPPADQQALGAILAQARTETSRREINLKTSNGRLVPVYLSASRLQSEGVELVFCLVLTDLTEQKSHAQIVAAERLARLILEQAAEAIVVCDEQGQVIRASQAALLFCDGSPLLRPFGEAFPLRTDASVTFHLAPVLQGETLRNVDVTLDRQGQKLDLILTAGPLLSGRQVIGCIVTLTDISERKRAEDALRVSQQVIEGILNAIPVRVFWKDKNLVYLGCNAIFARDAGFADPKDIIGKDDYQMGWRNQAELYCSNDRQVIENDCARLLIEEPQTTPEGNTITLLTSKIPLHGSKGEIVGILGTYMDITERKKNEETILRLNEQQQTILDASPTMIFHKDQENRFIRVNEALAKATGMSKKEMEGKTLWKLYTQEAADHYWQDDKEVMASGKPKLNVIEEMKTSQGLRLVQTDKIPYRNSAGEIIGIIGFSTDITERKQAEQAQRMSEARFATVFHVSPLNIAIARLKDGTFVDVNGAWEKSTGFTRKEAVGRKGGELNIWVNSGQREWLVRNVRERVAIHGFEVQERHKSGSIHDLLISAEQIDFAGEPCMLTMALDITERKRTEEETRQAYVREATINEILRLPLAGLPFDSLIEKALDLILAVPDLTLEKRGAVFLVEDDPNVLVLKAQRNLSASLSATCARVPFGKCLCGHEEVSGQVEFTDGIDERHGIHYEGMQPHGHYCVPLRTTDRTIGVLNLYVRAGYVRSARMEQFIIGVANALAGIFARKQDEAEKAKLEIELQQAQKMELVGRLAGGVAHDFNNMLGVILGYTDIALEQLDPKQPLHADLTEIRKAAQRSVNLTRQLLTFARKQTVVPRVLDLNETMSGMLKMLQRLIGENVSLAWQPQPDLWPVNVDPSQIDQIMVNLCVNARDSIANVGKITIEMGNSVLDENYCADQPGVSTGEYVRITVKDNGCGMDKEMLAHAFEPFFTTKGAGKGTGLGLATVYGAVKQNNGSISVYSEPGQGTTFNIYLPRHASKPERARQEGTATPAARGHATILLVDDDPAILKIAKLILEKQGYAVLAASTPEEAIRMAREYTGEIHLLMTDVVMPGMNGRDLANNLLPLRPNLKRLFMSGYTANVIAHQGVVDEGVNFIQKPFTNDDLDRKVREVLETRAAAKQEAVAAKDVAGQALEDPGETLEKSGAAT